METTQNALAFDTDRLNQAIDRAQQHLLGRQAADGHWVGELLIDSTLCSDYILLMHMLDRVNDRDMSKTAAHIWQMQSADGSWSLYPGGDGEISASVKAYFALKLAGHTSNDPRMARARDWIRARGGIEKANTFAKFYLAVMGEFSWDGIPAIPPELFLLPNWFYFNLYEMSSWSRGIFVPLMVLYSRKPVWPVPAGKGVEELYVSPPGPERYRLPRDSKRLSWRNAFLALDGVLKLLEKSPVKPLRGQAVRGAMQWMVDRIGKADGLGAIWPPIMNMLMVMKALGYRDDDPLVQKTWHEIQRLRVETEDDLHFQPCQSPVWDTAIALLALQESGLDVSRPELMQAARWLLDHQVNEKWDWAVKNPNVPAAGWYFEYANEPYPDNDDTAMVMLAMRRLCQRDEQVMAEVARAVRWLISMQSDDHGWGAFDRNNYKAILTCLPYADHNAMIDPSTADITARILESLSHYGYNKVAPFVAEAIAFIKRDQMPDGSWFGRWGVNYVYGTWAVLCGLEAAGEDMRQPYVRKAAQWFKDHQNPDGGWGESCRSYEDPAWVGKGESTPSQTAWALMGLMAAGEVDSEAVRNGVRYLVETQRPDGNWDEQVTTGTGFPKVFYLEYALYRLSFPLMALGQYRNRKQVPALREAAGIAFLHRNGQQAGGRRKPRSWFPEQV